MIPRVRVERALCIGAGECVRLAPSVFRIDDEDVAIVVDEHAGTKEQLEEAEQTCPAGAVFVRPH